MKTLLENWVKTHESQKTTDVLRALLNFLEIKNTGDFYKVYSGKSEGCRCGCQGNYMYLSEETEKKFLRKLKKARKILNSGEECTWSFSYYWFNISFGDNKALTFYKKEDD